MGCYFRGLVGVGDGRGKFSSDFDVHCVELGFPPSLLPGSKGQRTVECRTSPPQQHPSSASMSSASCTSWNAAGSMLFSICRFNQGRKVAQSGFKNIQVFVLTFTLQVSYDLGNS